MKSRLHQIIMLWFAVAVLAACQQETPVVKVYEVPAELQFYVDLFEQEAAKRGQDVVVDNLRILYEGDLIDGTAAGTCTYPHVDNPIPTIRFDTTSVNWSNNEYSREILFFHELGHCVLNRREHRNDFLPNGNTASIMRETGAQVYGGALNSFKREYYLDELFDVTTEAPDWATNIPDYNSGITYGENIFIEEFLDNRNFWNTGTSDNSVSRIQDGKFHFQSKLDNTALFTSKGVGLTGETDFEVEAKISIADGDNSVMIQWGGSGGSNLYYMGLAPDKRVFLGNWETGLAVAQEIETLNPRESVKLTIRRIGDRYHVYVDEVYFDILEYEGLFGDKIAFYVGPQTTLKVDWIRLKEIL